MKLSVIKTCLAIASLTHFGCNNQTTIQTSEVQVDQKMQDSIAIFTSCLHKFENVGFRINPQISVTSLIAEWKDCLQFNYSPAEAMYITLGNPKSYSPDIYYSDNCWHFDVKAMEGSGSYKRILDNISRISKGDIKFDHIDDYCDNNDDNKAWVAFSINGDRYRWNLQVDSVYPIFIDMTIFDKITTILEKYNKRGRLTYFPEGESCVFSYFTPTEFEKFNKDSGMKTGWFYKTSNKSSSSLLYPIPGIPFVTMQPFSPL